MAARSHASATYRFGFNGKENDGETSTQDYGMRIYNPALGKFLSVDPLFSKYPWYSPYEFAGDKPIMCSDLNGSQEEPRTQFSSSEKTVGDVLIWTDIEDITVLTTLLTRGGDAQNIDGTNADNLDIAFSAVGVFIPFVSGGAVKRALRLERFDNGIKKVTKQIGKKLLDVTPKFLDDIGTKIVVTLNATGTAVEKRIKEAADKGTNYIAKSFLGGQYRILEATEDIVVYRIYGGKSTEYGEFFTPLKPGTSAEAETLLNLKQYGNTANTIVPVTIKKGTQFAAGGVEGGKGLQIFIPNEIQNGNVIYNSSKAEKLN